MVIKTNITEFLVEKRQRHEGLMEVVSQQMKNPEYQNLKIHDMGFEKETIYIYTGQSIFITKCTIMSINNVGEDLTFIWLKDNKYMGLAESIASVYEEKIEHKHQVGIDYAD